MEENTNNTAKIISIKDEQTGADVIIDSNAFYTPVIPIQEQAYQEKTTVEINGASKSVSFNFPQKPVEDYQLDMWETLDKFEKEAWAPSNIGIKSGYDCIDKAFNGGLYPGVIMVAGDSNLGKTALISNLALNVIKNNDDVYVMDFSLDDSMPDKLARMVACSEKIVINSVKTPLKYKEFPLMLLRRKKALLELRAMTNKYRAYDSSFSTFVEDISKEIINKLIYFDEHQLNKKIVVFIDNFHDMDIRDSPNLSAKDKFDALAQWCQDFSTKYNITMVCSAELKKINGTRRPQLDDMRESVKIKYAAKAVLLVYNEVHYKGESANIYYSVNNNPYKQPIFEVHFAKNKYGTYKGRNFFEFYPDMAYLKESDPQAQKTYTSIVYG
jgi:replicative DNA helicase